jgi:hypothetical protein
MISRARVISVLQQHGIPSGWTPTAWYPKTGLLDETSTFYWEFGVRDCYVSSELYQWLGY